MQDQPNHHWLSDKAREKLRKISALQYGHPFTVEFYNPGTKQIVWSGWPTWAEAMARCAHYTRKYGQFDGFEKPRIKATGDMTADTR